MSCATSGKHLKERRVPFFLFSSFLMIKYRQNLGPHKPVGPWMEAPVEDRGGTKQKWPSPDLYRADTLALQCLPPEFISWKRNNYLSYLSHLSGVFCYTQRDLILTDLPTWESKLIIQFITSRNSKILPYTRTHAALLPKSMYMAVLFFVY